MRLIDDSHRRQRNTCRKRPVPWRLVGNKTSVVATVHEKSGDYNALSLRFREAREGVFSRCDSGAGREYQRELSCQLGTECASQNRLGRPQFHIAVQKRKPAYHICFDAGEK
jgi:hypothetical protein